MYIWHSRYYARDIYRMKVLVKSDVLGNCRLRQMPSESQETKKGLLGFPVLSLKTFFVLNQPLPICVLMGLGFSLPIGLSTQPFTDLWTWLDASSAALPSIFICEIKVGSGRQRDNKWQEAHYEIATIQPKWKSSQTACSKELSPVVLQFFKWKRIVKKILDFG